MFIEELLSTEFPCLCVVMYCPDYFGDCDCEDGVSRLCLHSCGLVRKAKVMEVMN